MEGKIGRVRRVELPRLCLASKIEIPVICHKKANKPAAHADLNFLKSIAILTQFPDSVLLESIRTLEVNGQAPSTDLEFRQDGAPATARPDC